MSDPLNDHAQDMTDRILRDVTVSEQNEEIHQGDYKLCMDESTNEEIIDNSDRSIDNQQPEMSDSATECIQVDVDDNNEIGLCTNKLALGQDLNDKTSESPVEFRKKSSRKLKNIQPCHKKKNAVVLEECLETRVGKILGLQTTSQLLMASVNYSSNILPLKHLCSEFEALFTSASMISGIKTDVNDQKHKRATSVCDNREANQEVQDLEDSSGKLDSKPLKLNPIDGRTILGHEKPYEPTDNEFFPKAGSSKDLHVGLNCISKNHGVQSLLSKALKSSDFEQRNSDLRQRKTSEVNIEASQEEHYIYSTLEDKVPGLRRAPEQRTSLKRSGDSQSEVPNEKYRRRCMSTGEAETVNESKQYARCISADVKKCSVDREIGLADGLLDDLKMLQLRKRKVDKGPKTTIKEFSCDIKRFKQDEKTLQEESSNEDSN